MMSAESFHLNLVKTVLSVINVTPSKWFALTNNQIDANEW